ncbi:MAG: hypothetical protein IPL61_00705 [Myxococcales bacterium]|nr:hypothetical protein [Myxococcales bacterium]
MSGVGILGLGTYLPPTVRTNAWWPPEEVARWSERMAHRATQAAAPDAGMSTGTRRTLAAMAAYADDPFRGAIERRVMDPEMTSSEMEARAAREALERAEVGPDQVDVILSQTPVPEHLMVNGATITHRLLGLGRRCLAIGTEGACNAFALHTSLATALIRSGQARHVLSVHSSAITRVHGPVQPHSAWWGDGAAAAVFGPVSEGRGLLAAIHNADGSRCDALVLGVPERAWWDDGAITTHAVNRVSTRDMLMGMVDRGGQAIGEALTAAGVTPADVDYYASHQSTPWLTRETAAQANLSHARTMITFPRLANMNSVNVPYILSEGARTGALSDGDVAVTFSGGLGETWSSLVFRWGR